MAVWIYPITASHFPPLSACTVDRAHRLNMLRVDCMRLVALVVEVECKKSCCSPRSVRLAAEGVSQASSEAYGCCKKVERMEWEAVVAGGS